jgi:hypothetical protein
MNGYICTKACTFGGVAYSVGDAIPFEAVLPSRERALIKQGFIAPADNKADAKALQEENNTLRARIAELEKTAGQAPESPRNDEKEQRGIIIIPITAKGGLIELEMKPEDIIKAVATLQLNAEEAAKEVGTIDKEEILILIDALDYRKTVKTAILERVAEIKTGGEEEQGSTEEDKGQGDE